MKKLIFVLILCLIPSLCFGAWAYKITKVEQRVDNPDTLTVTVDYTNGTNTVTGVEVPIFQPRSKADVVTGIKNRAMTIKQRILAEKAITNTVKPAVDGDINNPQPAE